MTGEPVPQWHTAQQLAGLPGMPRTSDGVRFKATNEKWDCRKKQSGKGLEYHINSLPEKTQAYLVQQHYGSPTEHESQHPAPSTSTVAGSIYQAASHRDKSTAQDRLQIVDAMAALLGMGRTRTRALQTLAADNNTSARSIERWYDAVKDRPRTEWLDRLTPTWGGGRPVIPIDEDVIELITEDFLRAEAPCWEACYDRLRRQLQELDIEIPGSKKLRAEINRRFSPAEQRYLRTGKRAARENQIPSQRRTVAHEHALYRINADGYKHNVMVQWPDEDKPRRPHVWYWQDVFSRRILGWAITKTENSDQIRISFQQLITQYGIPEHIHIDNTRAAANKILTGGMRNRYRTKYIEGEPVGLWLLLGIKVHFTKVYYGAGNGRAKPIERLFSRKGGLGEVIDKHPAFQGAYTGPSTSEKPDNYGSAAVDLETFTRIVESEITALNAKGGRRTEMGEGKYSYDEVFAQSYASSVISMPTKEQLRLFSLTAEAVKVQVSGKVTIKAGSAKGVARNEYWSRTLRDHWAGEEVVARFDPQNLHDRIYIYQKEGPFICEAEIWEAAGFGDTRKAREYDRFAKQEMKHLELSTQAKMRKSDLADIAEPPTHPASIPLRPAAAKIVPTPHLGAKRIPEQTLTAEQKAAHEKLSREFDDRLRAQEARRAAAQETSVDRMRRWVGIDDRISAGMPANEEEQRWWKSYQNTSEHKAGMRMIKNFGREGYLGKNEPRQSAG